MSDAVFLEKLHAMQAEAAQKKEATEASHG
jgi:hypothetical protein